MKKLFLMLGAVGLMVIGVSARQARATPYTVVITQQGSNVVANGSGAIDLAGLTFLSTYFPTVMLVPRSGEINTGAIISGISDAQDAYIYYASNGPTNFGTGTETLASSGSGSFTQFSYDNGSTFVGVPLGYISATYLTEPATLHARTFRPSSGELVAICHDHEIYSSVMEPHITAQPLKSGLVREYHVIPIRAEAGRAVRAGAEKPHLMDAWVRPNEVRDVHSRFCRSLD